VFLAFSWHYRIKHAAHTACPGACYLLRSTAAYSIKTPQNHSGWRFTLRTPRICCNATYTIRARCDMARLQALPWARLPDTRYLVRRAHATLLTFWHLLGLILFAYLPLDASCVYYCPTIFRKDRFGTGITACFLPTLTCTLHPATSASFARHGAAGT